jgi:hypothetical protein
LIRLKEHIAFLLFGIFFFPFLFQSLHILWHHSHVNKSEHNQYFQTITKTDFHSNGENVSEKKYKCPICAYKFSINDLPKIYFYYSIISVIACIYIELVQQYKYMQVFLVKTTRAPPVNVF